MMSSLRHAVLGFSLVGVACVDPPEQSPPVSFGWGGEWIDVRGYDPLPADTCTGTLEYLDAYAGALSREFEVHEHLGLYRWYSLDRFEHEDPCADLDVLGCAGSNGIFTTQMPHEHELAHLANMGRPRCPLSLSEGLAELYDTEGQEPANRDLSELLADPSARPDYDLAGALAAYLVESHGLDAVLSLCERTGRSPGSEAFALAIEEQLGLSTEQLQLEFNDYGCSYEEYRSKVYECGLDTVAQLPANIEIPELELELELGCATAQTVGPVHDEIWTVVALDVPTTGLYFVYVEPVVEVGDINVDIIECVGCFDDPAWVRSSGPDGSAHDLNVRAGKLFVRLSGTPDTVAKVGVTFSPTVAP